MTDATKLKVNLEFFKSKFLYKRRKIIMGSINIFNVQPHQVSRDMRGYSVFLYGGWKTFY